MVDHLVSDEVRALVARIAAGQGRLDVLVNDVSCSSTASVGRSTSEVTEAGRPADDAGYR